MRMWHVEFDFKSDTYLKLAEDLMKAKLRHMLHGNFDDIQLSVTFGNPVDEYNRNGYRIYVNIMIGEKIVVNLACLHGTLLLVSL